MVKVRGVDMLVKTTELPGTLTIQPKVFGDPRGYFLESYQYRRYLDAGIAEVFVQDNISSSIHGVLRGLHLQHPYGQGKLVSVIEGEVYDVAVDVRVGSPTFGRWTGVKLTGELKNQFWIPAGFAHGFQVLSEKATFFYKCTEVYRPDCEITIRWDDPRIGIDWPIRTPKLSNRDAKGTLLKDVPLDLLPRYPEAL
jgi:dTDP-4-dehydrorhamnose 3,5-epimerase